MKFIDMKRTIGVGAFVLGLAVFTVLPTSAQTNATNNRTDTTRAVERDNDTDWGWIGLLGLAGLAGLIPKKRHENVHQNRDTKH